MHKRFNRLLLSLPLWLGLILSTAGLVLLTALLVALHSDLPPPTISLLYLLMVLLSATSFGLGPGLFTSLLAFLLFNIYFIPPYRFLGVTSADDALRLLIFLFVALLASSLAGRARSQAISAARRAAELSALYDLSQGISAELAIERIMPRIAATAVGLLPIAGCRIMMYDQAGLPLEVARAGDTEASLSEQVPIRTAEHEVGAMQVVGTEHYLPLLSTEHELLQTLANQASLVIERARLAETASQARLLADSDQLKSALLSSISHDLRTPLALIKGAVTNLLDESVLWDKRARHELLHTINGETDRLNRLVGDMLQMSRIEAGALQRSYAWHDLGDLARHAVERLQSRFGEQVVQLSLPPELPLVLINYSQIEQVITNLLENALRYAPPEEPVELHIHISADDGIQVAVLDHGPGIPAELREQIFEKFVRHTAPERHADGSGLGLAICKGLVEAHGGTIRVEEREGGGACFVFNLPPSVVAPVAGVSCE